MLWVSVSIANKGECDDQGFKFHANECEYGKVGVNVNAWMYSLDDIEMVIM